VIYGLIAALGFGVADFEGALAGRRIGSLWAVMIGQGLSAVVATAILLWSGRSLAPLSPIVVLVVLNGISAAIAYQMHYRALELGPVAVVSPIGAAYAVVGVLLAVAFLNERPGTAALIGAAVTVAGVMLVSTDLRAFRAGVRGMSGGVPWALGSAVAFGIAGFVLGYLSQRAGWIVAFWGSRIAQVACYVPLAFIARGRRPRIRDRRGVAIALLAGTVDLIGVIGLTVGAARGYISVTIAASAVFPLVAVALAFVILRERLVPNQFVGIGLVMAGLLMLGFGS
jgi:drug/metabolite transporter (DMT)-like permease